MADLSTQQLTEILQKAPPDVPHDEVMRQLIASGHTFAGKQFDPATLKPISGPAPLPMSSAGQPIYPQQPEIGKGTAALQAISAPWSEHAQAIGNLVSPNVGKVAGIEVKKAEDEIGAIPKELGAIPVAGRVLGPAANLVGSLIPQSPVGGMAQAAGGAAAEVAAPFIGKAIAPAVEAYGPEIKGMFDKVSSGAKDLLADFVGAWTKKEPEYVKALFNDRSIMHKVGEAVGLEVQNHATQAIAEGRKALGEQVGAVEDGLAMFGLKGEMGKSPMVDTKTGLSTIVNELESRGHRIPTALGGHEFKLQKYALNPSDPEYKVVIGALSDMNKDYNFGEALNFKRELSKIIDDGIPGSSGLQKVSSATNAILKTIRRSVGDSLTESIPDAAVKKEWIAVNNAAKEGYDAFDSLHKQVIGSQPFQTVRRISQNMKGRTIEEMVLGPAAKVSEEAERAVAEIRDRVVAAQFRRRFTGPELSVSPRASGRLVQGLSYGTELSQGATRALAKFATENPHITGQSLAGMLAKRVSSEPDPNMQAIGGLRPTGQP